MHNIFARTLIDFERDGLLVPARFWLRNVDSKKGRQLLVAVTKAFDAWKETVVDERGLVMLSQYHSLLSTPGNELVPADTLKPHECAGPDVRNRIDLAFKLWIDDFQEFKKILDAHGLFITFAVVGVVDRDEANLPSLLRLNRFLAEAMSDYASLAEKIAVQNMGKAELHDRMTSGLSKGRQESARKRKEKKSIETAQMQQMAAEYWRAHPGAKVSVVERYLEQKFPRRSLSTIRSRIKGVKTDTLSDMDTAIPT